MDPSAPPPRRPSQPPPLPSKSYSGGINTLSPAPRPPSPTSSSSASSSSSSSTSILMIVVIIAICFLASVYIYFLIRIRFFSGQRRRHRRSSSSVASFPPPAIHPRSSSESDSSAADSYVVDVDGAAALSEKEKLAIIDSLPLFSLSSSLSVRPKSSPDCAVCLSPFLSNDDLRLLPACRHAFHAACIDNWLLIRDMPSCPLCRASITIHHHSLLLPSTPPLTVLLDRITADGSRLGSFRVEIGSVSLRRAPSFGEPGNPNLLRTYPIDSQWDYVVEEEVEAMVAEKRPDPAAAAPSEQLAGENNSRSSRWLKDYIDHLPSASSSFSSLPASGRWGHRSDSGRDAAIGRLPSWHWEGSARLESEDIGITSFYRWLVGAY